MSSPRSPHSQQVEPVSAAHCRQEDMGYNTTHYPTHLRHLVPDDSDGKPVRLVGPPAPPAAPLETPPSIRRMESDSSPVTSESSLSGGSAKRGKDGGLSRLGRIGKSTGVPPIEELQGEVVDIHVETAATVPPPVEVALEHSKNGGGIDDVMQTRWDYSRVLDADSGMTRVYSSHRLNADLEEDDDSSDGEYVQFGEEGRKAKKGLVGSLQAGLKRSLAKQRSLGDDHSERGAMRSSRSSASSFHMRNSASDFDDSKSDKSHGRSLRALSFRKSGNGSASADSAPKRSISFRSKGGDSKPSRSMNLRSAVSGKIGGGRGIFGRSASQSGRHGDGNEDQDWDFGSNADNFEYDVGRTSRRNRGRLGVFSRRG